MSQKRVTNWQARWGRLVGFRKLRSLTQQQVADAARVKRATIGNVECGLAHLVHIETREVVARGYGLPLHQFDALLAGTLSPEEAAKVATNHGAKAVSPSAKRQASSRVQRARAPA